MKELRGNIWSLINEEFNTICITTNGTIKRNGEAVMGAGIAKEAKERYPDLPARLAISIKTDGNKPRLLKRDNGLYLFSFPVKHNWWENADITLIERSAKLLPTYIDSLNQRFKTDIKKVLIPRPGCGNGKLNWSDVKPVIEPHLDDRFYIVTF